MVEVLVALAITMLIIPLIVASYINILHGYDAIRRLPARDLDLTTARNALLAEADYDTAQKGDQFDGAPPANRHVTWSAVIDPTTTADLFQVTFTCQLTGGSDTGDNGDKNLPDETITEIFRVLRPTWSQGTDSATLRAENKDRILQNPQLSPLSGVVGGDSAPSTSGAAGAGKGKGKNNGKGGQSGGGGAPGKNTGKNGNNTGKGNNNQGKGGRPNQGGNNNGGNFFNNGGFFNNNGNGGNNGNNGGSNNGAKGGARPKR